MSAYAGSLHTICRVVFWVFRFDQILVIALYFALHFDQIPSCTQYRRNLFYFQASNEFQPFFNTDQLSCRPSFLSSIKLAEVKHVYKNSFTPLVLLAVGTGFLLSITNYLSVCQNNPEWNMHKILASYGVWNISWPAVHLNSLCPVFGALLLMALGIWLEKKIPVARKLSNYAPACFLIFVLHYPLIMLIPSHIWKQSFFAPFVLIPAIIFLIVAFYLFLRKFFPACLPYVANDRITHVPKKN